MRLALPASSLAWLADGLYWRAWPLPQAESVVMIVNLHTSRTLFADSAIEGD